MFYIKGLFEKKKPNNNPANIRMKRESKLIAKYTATTKKLIVLITLKA